MGIGAGFATGQLVMKSNTDGKWYVTMVSGSSPSAVLFVSQSALPFTNGPIYQQYNTTASIVGYMDFFEQNYPWQIVASNNGLAYQVYLTGTAPNVTLVVSQSAYGKAFITTSMNAVIPTAKPQLFLQNISDGNYYNAGLTTNAGVTTMTVNQSYVPQNLVHPIY
jgi:hypothetical protein